MQLSSCELQAQVARFLTASQVFKIGGRLVEHNGIKKLGHNGKVLHYGFAKLGFSGKTSDLKNMICCPGRPDKHYSPRIT